MINVCKKCGFQPLKHQTRSAYSSELRGNEKKMQAKEASDNAAVGIIFGIIIIGGFLLPFLLEDGWTFWNWVICTFSIGVVGMFILTGILNDPR